MLAGCKFTPPSPVSGDLDASVDTPLPVDVPLGEDAGVAFCEGAGIVVCLELEGNTNDGTPNQLNTSMVNVVFEAGRVGMAARVGANSELDIPDNELLDVAAFTMEAWIQPDSVPNTGRRGLIDVEGQYGFFVHAGGLRCTGGNGGASPVVPANITAGVWTHVVCTDDATLRRIFVNGAMVLEESSAGISTNGNDGASIAGNNPSGERFLGLIDQARLWSRALTPDEVAAAAQ